MSPPNDDELVSCETLVIGAGDGKVPAGDPTRFTVPRNWLVGVVAGVKTAVKLLVARTGARTTAPRRL